MPLWHTVMIQFVAKEPSQTLGEAMAVYDHTREGDVHSAAQPIPSRHCPFSEASVPYLQLRVSTRQVLSTKLPNFSCPALLCTYCANSDPRYQKTHSLLGQVREQPWKSCIHLLGFLPMTTSMFLSTPCQPTHVYPPLHTPHAYPARFWLPSSLFSGF